MKPARAYNLIKFDLEDQVDATRSHLLKSRKWRRAILIEIRLSMS